MNERTERVLAGMAEDGVDALLLGTGANIRYATGARPLWLAGTRPWAPLATVLADGGLHLVANSDDGMPPEVDDDDLVRASWNPMTLMARLAAVDGLAAARTIGVDGLSPMFERLLTETFPAAGLVDATPLLHRARATKTTDELVCLRQASEIAAAGLADLMADPIGSSERQLHARFVDHMARSRTTIPGFDGTFTVVDRGQPLRRFTTDRIVAADDRVALDVGVMVDGYEGGLARTWNSDSNIARQALDRVIDACRPGVTLDELTAFAPDSPLTVAYGIGLGVEPLATEVGSTMCVQVFLDDTLVRDTLVIHPDGPELLTRHE